MKVANEEGDSGRSLGLLGQNRSKSWCYIG